MIEKSKQIIRRLFNVDVGIRSQRHSVRFAKQHFESKSIIAVEIGTFRGENASNIFRELNVEKFYVIDPYEVYKDYLKSEPRLNTKTLSNAFKEAKKRLGKYGKKVIFIKKYSEKALDDIPKADFIYIDGNHSYRFVKKDIEDYWPKVKSGGILAGHDITHEKFNRDIFRALKEFSNKAKQDPYISRTDFWLTKR